MKHQLHNSNDFDKLVSVYSQENATTTQMKHNTVTTEVGQIIDSIEGTRNNKKD